jgi:expansin (peptidoglycan-binding protein)
VHQGTATYYDISATGAPGNCSYDLTMQPEPPYWVAMNQARYADSAACGACVQINGTGSIVAQVVDQCPANSLHCDSMEHIDINRPGFGLIGDPNVGFVPISWKYVPCDVKAANVALFAQANSTKFYATVGVRTHRYRIAKVELVTGTTHTALVRRSDNFFIIDTTTPAGAAGMALGPFRIRITDIYNHWIENKVTLTPGQNVTVGLQFPACPAGGDAGT